MLSLPEVESFAIFEVGAGEPEVFFRAVTRPMNKVLHTKSAATLVEDAFDTVFFNSILGDNGGGIRELTVREESRIVAVVQF